MSYFTSKIPTPTDAFTLRLDYEVYTDEDGSYVTDLVGKVKRNNSSYYPYNSSKTCTIKIYRLDEDDDWSLVKTLSDSSSYNINTDSYVTLIDKSSSEIFIRHKEDGSQKVRLVFAMDGELSSYYPNGSISKTITLDDIEPEPEPTPTSYISTLNSASMSIGTNETITMSVNISKKTAYAYDRLFVYNQSGTLLLTYDGLSSGTNTISITDATAKQSIFNSIGSSYTTTLNCKVGTYSNSTYTTLRGYSSTLSFSASIPSYTLAIDSVSVVDSETNYDTYKPTASTYIANISKPTLTISASSSTGYTYGKTISYLINGTNRTSPFTDLSFSGNNYTIIATDNRISSLATNTNLTIVNYVRPTITCTMTRNTSVPTKANVSVSGTYYGGSGLTNLETATLTLKYTESGSQQVVAQVSFTPTLEDGIYSFSETFELTGLNAKKVLTWEIVLSDLVGIEASATGNLTKQYPLWHGYTDSNNEQVMNVYGDFEISGDYLRMKDISTSNKLNFAPTIVDSTINSLRIQDNNNDSYLPIGMTDKTLTLVINGTTYTFDGSVAQNITFNTSKSIITGSLSSDITKTSEGKITLNSFETSVNNAELASNNGGIKINSNSVSYVKVSANIRLTNGGSTQSFNLYIQKNGTTVSSQRLTNLDSSSQGSMSLSPILLPVSNGDAITLYLWKGNSNTTTLQADYTNLTVEVVK